MRELIGRNIPVFFGLSACSWVPHWACHYYRLETGTSFIVGSWSFSPTESFVSLVIYGLLIAVNLMAISILSLRIPASLVTGLGHAFIGSLHVYRLFDPFPFEVFGYTWSSGASLREVLIVLTFGVFSLYVALRLLRSRSNPIDIP